MLGAAFDEARTYPPQLPLEGRPARAEATAELIVGERSFGFEELWQMEKLLTLFNLHRSKAAGRAQYSPRGRMASGTP